MEAPELRYFKSILNLNTNTPFMQCFPDMTSAPNLCHPPGSLVFTDNHRCAPRAVKYLRGVPSFLTCVKLVTSFQFNLKQNTEFCNRDPFWFQLFLQSLSRPGSLPTCRQSVKDGVEMEDLASPLLAGSCCHLGTFQIFSLAVQ